MNFNTTDLSKQDEYLKSNITNMVNSANFQLKQRFTSFLDDRQRTIAWQLLNKLKHESYLFYGGIPDCERVILGIFPSDEKPDETVFPIRAIEVSYDNKSLITHQACLGSLMGLQLERSCIGDIVVENKKTTFFVEKNVAEFVLFNLTKIGRIHVTPIIKEHYTLVKEQKFQEIKGSVSSLRLDCVVALLLSKSRTIATETIMLQLVKVNDAPIQNNSFLVKPNDVISIRKIGKFIVCDDIKLTKKNKYFMKINKLI